MGNQHQADAYDADQASVEHVTDDDYLVVPSQMSDEQIALRDSVAIRREEQKTQLAEMLFADEPVVAGGIPNINRMYRAHVEGRTSDKPELTVFVEADSWALAATAISCAIAAMEHADPLQVAERIYNCHPAEALIEMGESPDLELRLFEIGWSGRILFVEQPIFLVPHPAPLCRKWMETQRLENTSSPELLEAAKGGAR